MKKKLVNAVVAAIMVISVLSVEMTAYATGTDPAPEVPAQEASAAQKRLVRVQIYGADGKPNGWTEYSYDSQGNRVKITGFNSFGSVYNEISYDSQGNTTMDVSYESGSILDWNQYNYDSQGNMVSVVFCSHDGSTYSIYSWCEYTYDDQGNRIMQIVHNRDGSLSSWSEYSYDSQGNKVREIYHEKDGSVSSWTEYSYGSQGHMTMENFYNRDGSVSSWIEYSYDDQGNMIKKSYFGSEGLVWKYEKYSYDAQGNLTEEISSIVNGSKEWKEKSKYSYDSQGNRTKGVFYSGDGSLSSWTEYMYEEERQLSAEDMKELESLFIQASAQKWEGADNEMVIKNVANGQLLCEVSFYRLTGFEFSGTIDSRGHAFLYDAQQAVRGELSFDGEKLILTLEEKPNYYFKSSLSKFIGGLQFVFG